MKSLVLFWSLHGTTRLIANRIAEGLRAQGAECALHDLREGVPADAAEYDVIGVGYPVHWFRPPTPVTEAIRRLGRLDGRSVFAFSLNGSYRGAGLNRGRAALARAGGVELGAFAAHGEDIFYPYAALGALFSPGHPNALESDAAFEFGRRLANAHRARERSGEIPAARPSDPATHPMYAVERMVTGPRMTRLLYSRLFRVDTDLCTSCGTCARRCPTHNIAWRRGAIPRWGRECVLCLECRTVCPEEAIACLVDWRVVRPFVRWNVRHAWCDPDLDHARVEFKRGKIARPQPRQ